LQNQAELQSQKVNKHKRINDSLNFILRKVLTLGRVPTKDFVTAAFNDNMEQIFVYLDRLKNLTSDDPALRKNVLECESAMRNAKQDLKLLRQSIQSGQSCESKIIVDARAKLFRDVDDAIGADFLILADKSSQGIEDDQTRELRKQIKILLLFAVGLSVIVGLLGATMFSRHLVKRLQKLEVNADSLAKGEPLTLVESGTDEVAEVDQSFHYAAGEIDKATRMRREVTAMIAHDLRTPLQSITSLLEMLRHGMLIRLNSTGENLLSTSVKEAARMSVLIDSVLQLEQLRSGHVQILKKAIAVVPIIEESIVAVKNQANAKMIEFKREYADLDGIKVLADGRWLPPVLVHILSNAVKFAPANSTVTVILHSTINDLTISISDRGPGVSESERDLIFERFHQVAIAGEQSSGLGLGLAVARELIELNHGSIDVESEPKNGCTFNVRLPRPPQ
jgi:signal transduction histidine kinase